MKKQIRLYFTDFWPVFQLENNFFLNVIKKKYDVILDAQNPEYLIYSCFGNKFLKYNCVKIFFSGENVRPDYSQCDWAFSSDYIDSERHYRLPIYFYMVGDVKNMTQPKPPIEDIIAKKTEFCNFIYSNPYGKKRNEFIKTLSKYKKVDSAGKHLNNTGFYVGDKIEFLKKYKFTISFENSEYDGYTTEKIFEPFVANSIPIYWGNPLVHKDFNTNSFLNYYDFPNEQALIERIIEIDNNPQLLAQYLAEPAFVGNKVNKYVDEENVLSQFDKIFNIEIVPVSSIIYSKSAYMKSLLQLKEQLKFQKFFFMFRLKFVRSKKIIQKIKTKLGMIKSDR